MDPSITLKITTLAEADSEKGKVKAVMVTSLKRHLSPPWKNDSGPSGFAFESAANMFWCLKKTLRKVSRAEARRPVFPVRQSPCLVSENTNMTECKFVA